MTHESLYPSGYAILRYNSADLPVAFEQLEWVSETLERRYASLFDPLPGRQTIEKVAAAFAAGAPTKLATEEEACVACILLESRFRRVQLDRYTTAELRFSAGAWQETFAPFRDKWMSKLLDSKENVAQSLTGGFAGVKGHGPFQLGHLAAETIAGLKKFRQLVAAERALKAEESEAEQEQKARPERPLLVDAYGGSPRTPPAQSPGLFVSQKSAASGLILPKDMERERLHEEWQARDRERKKHKVAQGMRDADFDYGGMVSALRNALVVADEEKHGLLFVPTFILVLDDPNPGPEAV